MLAYRHAYHAGNHADVFKHLLLSRLLTYLTRKDKPLFYLETHAGAGRYVLSAPYAEKTGEYRHGIARLWHASNVPVLARPYLAVIQAMNPDGQLHHYPGSPWIAARLLRAQDQLLLHELHRSDFTILQTVFGHDPRVRVVRGDGYAGCKAALPPRQRRGLILIDPSYELKTDYQQVLWSVRQGLRRFATGVYALWYPVVERGLVRELEAGLLDNHIPRLLLAELCVADDRPGRGMTGSGMVIINPPYTLEAELRILLPWLAEALRQQRHTPPWRLETWPRAAPAPGHGDA